MAQATVQRIERQTSDGPGQDRTDAVYALGAKIDGVFVPFITKSAGYIDNLVEQGRPAEDAAQAAAAGGDTGGDTDAGGA